VTGSTITAVAKNTEDDADYVSPAGNPDFDDLNQINTALTGPTPTKRKEQSLALQYGFHLTTGPATVTAKSATVSPMDFTPYSTLKFFVYKNSKSTVSPLTPSTQGTNFIFRAGSDTDYWQLKIPIDNLPPDTWSEITINQMGSPRANGWSSASFGGVVTSTGRPICPLSHN